MHKFVNYNLALKRIKFAIAFDFKWEIIKQIYQFSISLLRAFSWPNFVKERIEPLYWMINKIE